VPVGADYVDGRRCFPTICAVEKSPRQTIHRHQAEILAEIGRTARSGEASLAADGRFTRWWQRWFRRRQTVEVRLPESLARAAVDAWQQEDEVAPESETPEQREARLRAWTLTLIGSIVSERGRTEGNEVVVPLTDDVVDAAIAAADEPLG
jgi:hypothetical protein